jgi:hypothetical protein
MINTLTPAERDALDRLLTKRHQEDRQYYPERSRERPTDIIRLQGQIYLRIYCEFFWFNGDEFTPYEGVFPTANTHKGVKRVR